MGRALRHRLASTVAIGGGLGLYVVGAGALVLAFYVLGQGRCYGCRGNPLIGAAWLWCFIVGGYATGVQWLTKRLTPENHIDHVRAYYADKERREEEAEKARGARRRFRKYD